MNKLLFLLLLSASAHSYDNKELECLALNVYHESRSESLAGQFAVADVVLNRVESSDYPNTICGVVQQAHLWKGNPVRNKCQFSWYCDGKSDKAHDNISWQQSVEVAIMIAQHDRFRGITEGADHYHTRYVDPYWNKNLHLVTTIDHHIFYKKF